MYRPYIYVLNWNAEQYFFSSSWVAYAIYEHWLSISIKEKMSVDLKYSVILAPSLRRLYGSHSITKLLNGQWKVDVLKHAVLQSGDVKHVEHKSTRSSSEIGVKRIKINRFAIDKKIADAFALLCEDRNMLLLCLECPTWNVFHALLKAESSSDAINQMLSCSKELWDFINRPGKFVATKTKRNRMCV